jgi:hypothetical protein
MQGAGQGYIRFDERSDVIASIELCSILTPLIKQDPLFWKWLIVAAHNGLYGSLVCVLSGTAGVGALTPKSASKVLDYLETNRGPFPEERLETFAELLRRAQDRDRMSYLGGQPLTLTDSEKRDLNSLNELRRGLVHFTPKGWSIEVAGLPRIIQVALRCTKRLMFEHPTTATSIPTAEKRRLERAFETIAKGLDG